jgi:hypothetical protein
MVIIGEGYGIYSTKVRPQSDYIFRPNGDYSFKIWVAKTSHNRVCDLENNLCCKINEGSCHFIDKVVSDYGMEIHFLQDPSDNYELKIPRTPEP